MIETGNKKRVKFADNYGKELVTAVDDNKGHVKCPTAENGHKIEESGHSMVENGHQIEGSGQLVDKENIRQEKFTRIMDKYKGLFDGSLGRTNHYIHRINMVDKRPHKARTYPIPEKNKLQVREKIETMENLGVIEKQATQYINPLVAVQKTDGKIRICLDARMINAKMEIDHTQLPTIDQVLSAIGQRKIFTKLDISEAFWQIPLERESQQYTGFLFENQSYVFKRMPFGLKTAGTSFTRAIEAAMEKESGLKPNIIIYLDDVLIASENERIHAKHLEKVFKCLQEAGFKLKREKCVLATTDIKFLGHEISSQYIKMSEETKDNIAAFPTPRNKKEIQAFLGLSNWDRRFVSNLANKTRPLEKMLQKNEKFKWTNQAQRAFEDIKEAFMKADTLALIDPKLNFGLDTDASTIGLGARLYQFDEERGQERTTAYASRSLRPAETRYTITELEGLALVWALRKWIILLAGRRIKVNTDHKALTFFTSCANTSQRIVRWTAFLQEFELDVRHIPGSKNLIADTLSRYPIANNSDGKSEEIIKINVMSNNENTKESPPTNDVRKKQQWYREKGPIYKNVQGQSGQITKNCQFPIEGEIQHRKRPNTKGKEQFYEDVGGQKNK